MNIHDAIMRAADHIESHPDDFSFMQGYIPHSCGTPGCALGWIGFFADNVERRNQGDFVRVASAIGVPSDDRFENRPDLEFYNRLDVVLGDGYYKRKWQTDPVLCARALRLYAAAYHPKESSESTFVADLMKGITGKPIPADIASEELA